LEYENQGATSFLQHVSIACYAECTLLAMIDSVHLSVTRWYHAKTTQARIMQSSLEDSPHG